MRVPWMDNLAFKPVSAAEWEDFQALFSEPGVQRGCWCMYWRVRRSDFHRHFGENHRQAMREIVESGQVPGILAYVDGRPAGWCSVAPREHFPVLQRSRTLKPVDDRPVWSIVCFFISAQYRHAGLSNALLQAAVSYAREQGARIVEAYPLTSEDPEPPGPEHYMGYYSTFCQAGFEEVLRRSDRRAIVRLYLED